MLVVDKLGRFSGPNNNNSRNLETDSRGPETETRNPETEERVHRIHNALETGLQSVLRSLVAPHKELPADSAWVFWVGICYWIRFVHLPQFTFPVSITQRIGTPLNVMTEVSMVAFFQWIYFCFSYLLALF